MASAAATGQVESKMSRLTLVEEIKPQAATPAPSAAAVSRHSDDGQQTVLTTSDGTGTGSGGIKQTVTSLSNTKSIVKVILYFNKISKNHKLFKIIL
jgi:hypothetical protein